VTDSAVERYLKLGPQLGRHVDGIVDAYYGPPELAAPVEAEPPVNPQALVSAAEALLVEFEDGWPRDQVGRPAAAPLWHRCSTSFGTSSLSGPHTGPPATGSSASLKSRGAGAPRGHLACALRPAFTFWRPGQGGSPAKRAAFGITVEFDLPETGLPRHPLKLGGRVDPEPILNGRGLSALRPVHKRSVEDSFDQVERVPVESYGSVRELLPILLAEDRHEAIAAVRT
jgi:hypothetical protein